MEKNKKQLPDNIIIDKTKDAVGAYRRKWSFYFVFKFYKYFGTFVYFSTVKVVLSEHELLLE